MRKIIQLDDTLGGEPTVRPVLLWGANGRPLRELGNTKTASEASDYVMGVEPKPGYTIVLVLALGSYEFYDLNRNGDGFNESPYKVGFKPTCGCCTATDGWIKQEDVIQNHYKSFEQHGKVYRHHQNKDPAKSCGEVLKSFWNPTMHRIELLIGVKNDLAPDLVERIADGAYPAVSMGCRIKYDVCTECGHRAPTRANYCDHLKYKLRRVGSKGLRYGALNPSPRWFDISWVVKPADQTGFMMKKVAEEGAYEVRASADLGAYIDAVEEKRAAIQKVSDIDKIVRGIPIDHKTSPVSEAEAHNIRNLHDTIRPALQRMPLMDDVTLGRLAEHPVAEVLSTLSASGVVLTTPEFVKLLVAKLAPGTQLSEETLDAIVAMQGQVFDLFARHPQLLDQVTKTRLFDIRPENVRPEIAGKANWYLEKRSTFSEYLKRTLIPPDVRPEEPPFTDLLHVRDPASGRVYKTTRGAAMEAHDDIAGRQLAKLVGGSALLAGGYKLLAGGIPAVARPAALAATALVGGATLRPDWGPQYVTEEGLSIPATTELSMERTAGETTSTLLPVLGTMGLVAGLGHDYESRLRRGEFVHNPESPRSRRALEAVERQVYEHPALSALGALSAYGLGRGALRRTFKLGEYLDDTLEPASDSVVLPDVDFDAAAMKIGLFLLGSAE